MKGIGVREVVSLLALALAAGIGLMFLDPSASESKGSPQPVHLGDPPTPTPSATPTPVPVHMVDQPASWLIEYIEQGFDTPAAQGVGNALAYEYAGAPFPDFKDDRWSMRATATVEVTASGLSGFKLRHQGQLTVKVDGKVVAADPGGAERILDVQFDHTPGNADVVIEQRDSGGPFELRWE